VRHRLAGRKLGRNTNQRKALFRNLTRSLILQERIKTTLAKAKAIRGLVDRLLNLGRSGTLSARRRALAILPDKPAVAKLFGELAVRAKNRTSGFTRIRRVGRRRGDQSVLVQIELVDHKINQKV
jgi:large subunit ribosomal protein L17